MMLAVAVQPSITSSIIRRNLYRVEKVAYKCRRAVKLYQKALEEKPVKTNAVTGLALGVIGDVFCQVGIEKKDWKTFDWKRLIAFSTFNSFYSSTLNLKLFQMYPSILPAAWTKTPLREGISSSFVDNLIHSPMLYLPMFYAWTGAFHGESLEDSCRKYASQFLPVMGTLLAFWMPLQTINFGYVPRKQRVVFVCGANLAWNCILDFLHNN